uniref:Uncharacterized protein n=1 Tax=Rhizophora mucronata TaxID=61149 RepID=A0A2P2QSS4_RHIMU
MLIVGAGHISSVSCKNSENRKNKNKKGKFKLQTRLSLPKGPIDSTNLISPIIKIQ